MAANTWYLTNNSVSVGSDLSVTDPGTEAYRSPVTGWVVSTGATNRAAYQNDTEVAASAFTSTTPPDGSLDTTNGDFWVSPIHAAGGTYASANWNIHFACRAQTVGGAQDGRMRCRLFKGPNQNGSSATEITGAQQNGGLVTNLATSATQVSTATFNPGSFTVAANDYVFVQLAWERTGAGGMSTSDVNVRIGNGSGTGSRVITSNFTRDISLDAASGSYSISGTALSTYADRLINAAAGSYSLTGADLFFERGYSLSLDAGSYAITGSSLTTLRSLVMNAVVGSYSISGSAASLLADRSINAAAGSYTISGMALTSLADRILNAVAGTYSLSGSDLTTLRTLLLNAEAGSYNVSGTDLTTLRDVIIVADAGTYIISGADATLVYGTLGSNHYELICDPGTYSISGVDASLILGRVLNAEAGAYALTGSDASLLHGYEMNAAAGAYLIVGENARAVLELDTFPAGGADGIRIDVVTGKPVLILNNKLATLL